MRKSEELLKSIENMRRELLELARKDKRIFEIIEQLDSFEINPEVDANGKIRMYCGGGFSILKGGRFEENEMLYALAIMDFYSGLYYKCRKIIRRIRKKEYRLKIDALLLNMGRIIRKQALNVKPNEEFETERFYIDFKAFVQVAIKALGHKYDQIGYRNLTDRFDAEEAKELKHIRTIYEKISFKETKITYFDYITKTSRTFCINNTVEMQYMIMILYTKAYTESVLWLKKEDPTEQWCPATPWQLIRRLDIMIPSYFLY